MKWYVALMYNTLSAAVAIIGMFVGVAIGHASEDSTPWILAITAGVFLYVALVDLVRQLINVVYVSSSLAHEDDHMCLFCYIISAPWVDGDPQRMQRLEVIFDINVMPLGWLHDRICHLAVDCDI